MCSQKLKNLMFKHPISALSGSFLQSHVHHPLCMYLSVSCLLLLWAVVKSFECCQWELNSSWKSRWTQDPAVLTVSQLSSLFSCLSTIFTWFPNLRFSSIIKSFLPPSFRVQLPGKCVHFSCQKHLSVPKFLHSFIFCYCNCFSGPFSFFLNLPKVQEWGWGLGGLRQESLYSYAIVAGYFCQVTGLCLLLECNSV